MYLELIQVINASGDTLVSVLDTLSQVQFVNKSVRGFITGLATCSARKPLLEWHGHTVPGRFCHHLDTLSLLSGSSHKKQASCSFYSPHCQSHVGGTRAEFST